jgi:predicted RNA binding protein YcfA (HicA-like mRNA interferase family)
MSKRLPALRSGEVIRALERAGFTVRRQSSNHIIMYKPDLRRPISIPRHTGDLPRGTLRAIIRQAGLTVERFLEMV